MAKSIPKQVQGLLHKVADYWTAQFWKLFQRLSLFYGHLFIIYSYLRQDITIHHFKVLISQKPYLCFPSARTTGMCHHTWLEGMCVCMCARACGEGQEESSLAHALSCVDVWGQLVGESSLFTHVEPWDWTQATRLGGRSFTCWNTASTEGLFYK